MDRKLSQKQINQKIVIAVVIHEMAKGKKMSKIFKDIIKEGVYDDKGKRINLSLATLYRWWKQHQMRDKASHKDRWASPRLNTTSLPQEFIDFMCQTKDDDWEASIPEVIRQAEALKIISPGSVNRCTAYRCAKRLGLPLVQPQGKRHHNMMRFSYPNRMMMVLCDGKHFRAGKEERKRVAFVFLDDATRYVPVAVVGTSENAELFARGLFELIARYGVGFFIFFDNGSAFISHEIRELCHGLGITIIHGTPRYPEGRGKIERWNRTFQSQLLRAFRGNPNISSEIPELEDRINHYIHEIYNKTPHSSLKGKTPLQRWNEDERPLQLVKDIRSLKENFYFTFERKVSRDNVVNLNGVWFEAPTGSAGRHVKIRKDLISSRYFLWDQKEERYIDLSPVNPTNNSYIRRKMAVKERGKQLPTTTAATLVYEQCSPTPLVDSNGNCFDN